MLASCALHCPGPCIAGVVPWIAQIWLVSILHHSFSWLRSRFQIYQFSEATAGSQVNTTVNSERTMQGCPWYGSPILSRSTDIYWRLLSKPKSSSPTDSPFSCEVRHRYLPAKQHHANTFSWTCTQLCSTHLHQIYLGKTALLQEESRKFIIWLFPYPWSPLHRSFSLLYLPQCFTRCLT